MGRYNNCFILSDRTLTFLQNGGFADFCIGILSQGRYQNTQGVKTMLSTET